MERLEMVDKIKSYSDISTEEAKSVLERNNWDVLDAMVELERDGKCLGGAKASTKVEEPKEETLESGKASKEKSKERRASNRQKIKEGFRKAFRVVIDNYMIVSNADGEITRCPIIIPIICTLAAFWLVAIVMVVSMTRGIRYSFAGKEIGRDSINKGMMKAGDCTEKIINDIMGKTNKEE